MCAQHWGLRAAVLGDGAAAPDLSLLPGKLQEGKGQSPFHSSSTTLSQGTLSFILHNSRKHLQILLISF